VLIPLLVGLRDATWQKDTGEETILFLTGINFKPGSPCSSRNSYSDTTEKTTGTAQDGSSGPKEHNVQSTIAFAVPT